MMIFVIIFFKNTWYISSPPLYKHLDLCIVMATSSSSDFRIFSSIWKEQLKKKKIPCEGKKRAIRICCYYHYRYYYCWHQRGRCDRFLDDTKHSSSFVLSFFYFFKQKFQPNYSSRGWIPLKPSNEVSRYTSKSHRKDLDNLSGKFSRKKFIDDKYRHTAISGFTRNSLTAESRTNKHTDTQANRFPRNGYLISLKHFGSFIVPLMALNSILIQCHYALCHLISSAFKFC